jgi:hypothetical protein
MRVYAPCPRIGESTYYTSKYYTCLRTKELCEPCLSMFRVYTPCPRMRVVYAMSKYVYKTSLGWEGTSLLGHVCEGWGEWVEEGGDHVYPETVLDGAGKPERGRVFKRSFL